MRPLFDASALLNIVRSLGTESLEYLRGGHILTLTLYEIGNALWKEAVLLDNITLNEAISLLNQITKIRRILNVTEPQDTQLVIRVADKLKITYYDSSYIVAAYELNTVLVTDDNRLRKRIHEKEDALTRILGDRVASYTTEEYIKTRR